MKLIIEKDDGTQEISDVNVINLEENDVVVLKADIDKEKSSVFTEKLSKIFPNNKVIILPKDSSIDIIRQEKSNSKIKNRKVLKG